MKKPRLTKQEVCAVAEAARILPRIKMDGAYTFVVEWKKSAQYDLCPSISSFHGNRVAYAGGCGYDKLSACVADFLRFLFATGTPEHDKIAGLHGCGMNTVIAELDKLGWTLKNTASGKTFDVFSLTKKEKPE